MTQQRPTFTTTDLSRVIDRHIRNPATREQFTREILNHPDAVPLPGGSDEPAPRYTAKPVLETEQEIIRAAARLAHSREHPVSNAMRAFILKTGFKTITPEQARAARDATGAEGLALIDGQAGTGKTYVMRAIRRIYEAQGYDVTGLAPTNAVARQMRDDGFTKAHTLHAELWALDHGRRHWTDRTVVMLDEAAMIDSRNLARLTRHAQASGAKLILTGDDRQLPSIEAGGMFAVLKRRFGAARLTEVYRQQRDDDRRAAEMMADGNFQDALASYERNHDIHWTETQDEARAALIGQWAKDTADGNTQSRFVFAYTNSDVNSLNAALHQIRAARGELGAAYRFMTKHGGGDFAAGDRIQFTGTDKPQGIFNGEAGTIRAITGSMFAVALDGEDRRLLTFNARTFRDFRLGYAGTIYKGQGRTIDQTYLYHSQHWNAAPSYVAFTRHRKKTALFVAHDTAADLHQLTEQIARVEDRRAASEFVEAEAPPPDHQAPAAPAPKPPAAKPVNPSSAFREAAKETAARKPPEPKPEPKRRRKTGETTGKAFAMDARRFMRHILGQQRGRLLVSFRQFADQLREPPAFADFGHFFTSRLYDPQQEAAYAEQITRIQMEEWARHSQPPQDQAFHYGSAAGFDAQP
jgi:Ti-type conjugative transfer relaxase TraA